MYSKLYMPFSTFKYYSAKPVEYFIIVGDRSRGGEGTEEVWVGIMEGRRE